MKEKELMPKRSDAVIRSQYKQALEAAADIVPTTEISASQAEAAEVEFVNHPQIKEYAPELLDLQGLRPTIPAEILRRLNSAKAGEKWMTLLSAVITLIFTFVVVQVDLPIALKVIIVVVVVSAIIMALWKAAERAVIEILWINSQDMGSPRRLWVAIVVLSLILLTSVVVIFVERFDAGLMFAVGIAGLEVSSLLLAGCFGALVYFYSAIPDIFAKYDIAVRTYAQSRVAITLRLKDIGEFEALQTTLPVPTPMSLPSSQQPPSGQIN